MVLLVLGQVVYKEGFGRLRELKSDIEGLHAMLEHSRTRLQADFEQWLGIMSRQAQPQQQAQQAHAQQQAQVQQRQHVAPSAAFSASSPSSTPSTVASTPSSSIPSASTPSFTYPNTPSSTTSSAMRTPSTNTSATMSAISSSLSLSLSRPLLRAVKQAWGTEQPPTTSFPTPTTSIPTPTPSTSTSMSRSMDYYSTAGNSAATGSDSTLKPTQQHSSRPQSARSTGGGGGKSADGVLSMAEQRASTVLTGNAEADADILAFYKARERLLMMQKGGTTAPRKG
eukprot:jgi/Chlat1/1779/Chrsp134S08685